MSAFQKTTATHQRGATTLPQRYFTSPEIFAQEQERIFSEHWLAATHLSEIAIPGDFVVREIAGESLIFLRDHRNELHGYFNVCRHRGTRLCEQEAGQLHETIQCPYHAWTYSLDGRLVGAPHMDRIEGFDKREYSSRFLPPAGFQSERRR